jgi:hypothetical protein
LPVLFLTAGKAEAARVSSLPIVSISTFNVEVSTVAVSSFTWRTVPNATFPKIENFSYVVKWGLLVAGYSSLSVKGVEPVNGRPTYHLVSEAKSGGVVSAFYTVHDHNEAWLDEQAMVTVRYEKRIHEGSYGLEESTIIDQPNHRFQTKSYRLDKNLYEQKDGEVPPDVLDVLGSLYYVRLLPLDVGQSYTMDVLSGDKVYPLIVKVEKRETIKVPAGRFDTIRVEPLLRAPGIFIAKGKKLQVWLTDDERRIPVRMRSEIAIGHVSAELLPAKTELDSARGE